MALFRRGRLGRLALWTLALLPLATADFVRAEIALLELRGLPRVQLSQLDFHGLSLQCTWDRGVHRNLTSDVGESWWAMLLRPIGIVPLVEWGEGNISRFDAIDVAAGTARLAGNQGSGPIRLLVTPTGFTFFETTVSGSVSITTIFATPVGYRYRAVISRHMDFSGEVVVSQYTGFCVVVEP